MTRTLLSFFLFSLFIETFAIADVSYANKEQDEPPMTLEECASMWKKFMTTISDEDARIVCQCIEDEKKAHPVDAENGATLSGMGGMDNAGPWPNIFNKCLIQGVPALKNPTDVQ